MLTTRSYPESGTFESAGPCPATHPVRTSQVMFEVIWDTSKFNNPADWPEDGSQPFVWSFGDATGYANHADYVFGWKDDSLQKILDTSCYAASCGGKQQNMAAMNKCAGIKKTVTEDIGDGTCKDCILVTSSSTLTYLKGCNSFLAITMLSIVDSFRLLIGDASVPRINTW